MFCSEYNRISKKDALKQSEKGRMSVNVRFKMGDGLTVESTRVADESTLNRPSKRLTVESTRMVDESTLKRPSKRLCGIKNKIRPFMKKKRDVTPDVTSLVDPLVVDHPLYGPVCLLQDSPTRIFKCAQNGNAKEVAQIIKSDPTKLKVRNHQDQTALHVAASKGHLEVVRAIVDAKADLNAVDNHGNTALHLAVKARSPEIVNLLMKNGADANVKNKAHAMAVHLAATLDDLKVMKALLDNGVDANSVGEAGQTILHYAAAQDNGEMLKLVMANGGRPCTKCDYGYYPIHIAARSAAANSMEAIIDQALQYGYTREEILTFRDRENNLPLHSAVNGGNLKAVSVCLQAGASVKAQQEGGCTPLHLACSQGNMDMIQLMKDEQAENFTAAVLTYDSMKMTPLHKAALFNHKRVIDFLLNEHADIDARDIHERTPLLLAASKGAWGTVQMLVARGVDMRVKDKNNRNFLHLAIKFGGNLKCIADLKSRSIQDLLNERDDFGCTPLHYASKEGHLDALDDLIKMGAVLNLKDNHKQSPFHFAAKYGRLNTCRRLLDSVQGPNLINETDGHGYSALHIAAKNGHTKIIHLLLERGAVISKDNLDNTALHHAAGQGWTHSMRILLSIHHHLRDLPNMEGDTALHTAAKKGKVSAVCLLLTLGAKILTNKEDSAFFDYVIQEKHVDVAVAVVNHDRWEEVLQYPSAIYGYYILGLIQHLPAVCINVLDRCQVPSDDDPKSCDFHITYNFKFLESETLTVATKETIEAEDNCPMMPLRVRELAMVKNNREECLSHPVCTTFLEGKWHRYGMWFNISYLSLYIVFLGSITSVVVNEDSLKHFDLNLDVNQSTDFLHGNQLAYDGLLGDSVCLWIIAIYCSVNIAKEVVQILDQKARYLTDITNLLEWSLYISTLVFVVPFLSNVSLHWQWESGAIAVFLAWFNCLVFLQRFDFFGIYVVMFLEILRTLVQVLCVFSILIIAFGLSFYLLMFKEESKAYSTPGLSFLRTFMMMLELDYMDSFNSVYVDDQPETLHFDNLTLVFLVAFVLLMPILLMNLLIGLAVGDIEAVQKDARLKRLAMQVELHISMEKKMPKCLHKYVKLTKFENYPNNCKKLLANMSSIMSKTYSDSEANKNPDQLHQHSYIYQEMYRQKVRMQEMNSFMEKNYQLLRKIMETMEIHTEEDAWDEGGDLNSDDSESEMKVVSRRLNARYATQDVSLKTAVVDVLKVAKK